MKEFDFKTFEFYKAKTILYKTKLAKYEKQIEAFKRLIQFIQNIISINVAVLIQNVNASVADGLSFGQLGHPARDLTG